MTEPLVLQVTRYKCPFCTRSRSKRDAITAHIARCWYNPQARSCKTCVHYEAREDGPYPEHPGFPETCGAERDLNAGLVTGCTSYEPAAAPVVGEQPHE